MSATWPPSQHRRRPAEIDRLSRIDGAYPDMDSAADLRRPPPRRAVPAAPEPSAPPVRDTAGPAPADQDAVLKGAIDIDGALGVALVHGGSGTALGTAGSPTDLDLDIAAAGNSTVVQATLRTLADLGVQESIEDILITLDEQYHIIRPLARQENVFLQLVLDRARANLAMARFKLAAVAKDLTTEHVGWSAGPRRSGTAPARR